MSYTVYGLAKTRAFRVLWMLEEMGASYDHIPAAPRSDEIRAVSALGKVPVLADGDALIRDSVAILTYLADKHGAFSAPAGTPARGAQDAMTFRILDELDAVLWTAARHSFILPKEERVAEVKPTCKAEFARNIVAITQEIKGPYLMGEALTVPDFVLTQCADWARAAKFPELPDAFLTYLERTRSRPAFRKVAAL